MQKYEDLEPKKVFYWFKQLNNIPRGSGNEKAVSDFLVDFAKQRGLEVHQDSLNNVIIKKDATKGYENSDAVILQGHMDMVCEKADGSNHDFTKDPITMHIKDGFVYADNTTLGADDGIAVAFCLAILDSDDVSHPKLEVLITTDEERGMDGANAVTAEHLSGTRLLNIDTEDEGDFIVSCSGGANAITTFKSEKSEGLSRAIEISISGLNGGHSGLEIQKQNKNAIKVMARLLNKVALEMDFRLQEISGGSKHNAIAKNAHAVITVDDLEKAMSILNEIGEYVRHEGRKTDPNFVLDIKETTVTDFSYSKETSQSIVKFLYLLINDVISTSQDIEGLVQTSSNVGIVEADDEKIKVTCSVRSSVESELHNMFDKIKSLAYLTHGTTVIEKEYPAWEFNTESELAKIAPSLYEEMTGKKANVTAIHAGLECGLLKGVLPNCDMISFGPDIFGAHTPLEHLKIDSTQRMYDFTLKLLEKLK